MFVQRNLYKMQDEHWDEIKEQMKKNIEGLGEGAPNIRVYLDFVGTHMNAFVVEFEWESMAEMESTWDKWTAAGPDAASDNALRQWTDGVSTEVWRLVEF